MATQRRVFKIGERIHSLIAMQLLKVADPRFSIVTITSVVVSPDLRNAKIYWIVSGDEERKAEVAEAFQSAEGLFRRLIAKELGTRFVPSLSFFYDDTLDTAARVEELLARIKTEYPKHEE